MKILIVALILALHGCPTAGVNAADGAGDDENGYSISHTWKRFGPNTPESRTLRDGFGR